MQKISILEAEVEQTAYSESLFSDQRDEEMKVDIVPELLSHIIEE